MLYFDKKANKSLLDHSEQHSESVHFVKTISLAYHHMHLLNLVDCKEKLSLFHNHTTDS